MRKAKIIKYEVDSIHHCPTVCPQDSSNRVGSIFCSFFCMHNIMKDSNKKLVLCGAENENTKN